MEPAIGHAESSPAESGTTIPLLVFVHVPKTAGSTVNAALARWRREGAAHCEQIIGDPGRLAARVRDAAWISGHVPFDRFRAALAAVTARPLRFATLIREPTAQIASHYNWLIEIFHRGRAFYDGHPPEIRRISAHIRASDNSDPGVVAANLRAYGGLFLNQQARHVLGAGFDWSSGQVFDRLLAYDHVAADSGPGDLVCRMTGHPAAAATHENASPYRFDRAVFDTDEMRTFLLRHHFFDYALHDAVCRLERPRPA